MLLIIVLSLSGCYGWIYKMAGWFWAILQPKGNGENPVWLTFTPKTGILMKSRSRGDSGALYLQSATAGVIPIRGCAAVAQLSISGVDVWVLCGRDL